MFDIQNYGSFIIAVVVFQIIPGAGTITILNATARNGVGMGDPGGHPWEVAWNPFFVIENGQLQLPE